MYVINVELIVGGIGCRELHRVACSVGRRTYAIVAGEAGQRLHVGRREREVNTELRTQGKVLHRGSLGVDGAQHLVFLHQLRVSLHPLDGVLRSTRP